MLDVLIRDGVCAVNMSNACSVFQWNLLSFHISRAADPNRLENAFCVGLFKYWIFLLLNSLSWMPHIIDTAAFLLTQSSALWLAAQMLHQAAPRRTHSDGSEFVQLVHLRAEHVALLESLVWIAQLLLDNEIWRSRAQMQRQRGLRWVTKGDVSLPAMRTTRRLSSIGAFAAHCAAKISRAEQLLA